MVLLGLVSDVCQHGGADLHDAAAALTSNQSLPCEGVQACWQSFSFARNGLLDVGPQYRHGTAFRTQFLGSTGVKSPSAVQANASTLHQVSLCRALQAGRSAFYTREKLFMQQEEEDSGQALELTRSGKHALRNNRAHASFLHSSFEESATLEPGSVIALKGGRDSKYCSDEGDKIICDRDSIGGASETFTVESAKDGKVALKGGKDGKYCADEGDTIKCNRRHIRSWEEFTVESVNADTVALKGGKDNKYCADEPDTIRCEGDHLGSWEKFVVEEAPAPTTQDEHEHQEDHHDKPQEHTVDADTPQNDEHEHQDDEHEHQDDEHENHHDKPEEHTGGADTPKDDEHEQQDNKHEITLTHEYTLNTTTRTSAAKDKRRSGRRK